MKKFSQLCVLCIVLCISKSRIPIDKQQHALVSAALVWGAAPLVGWPAAAGGALLVGAAKEWYDQSVTGAPFDWGDLGADAAGVGFGILLVF